MPETESSKFGLTLTSHSSEGSVSGVPIKKRLCRSHYNYSRSLELSLQDHQISTIRPSGLELENTVSDKSSDLFLHSDISGQSSSASHNSSSASTYENISHESSNVYGLENARLANRGTSTAGLTLDDTPFDLSSVDNSKFMSLYTPPTSLVSEEGDICKRSSISDKSVHLANLKRQLTSSSDVKSYGNNLMRQEASEKRPLGVPLAHQNTSAKTNVKVDPVMRTNRLYLDLNIPAEPLDAIVEESIAGNAAHELNVTDKYQEKIQLFPIQAIPHGNSGTPHHELRSSNLGKTAGKHKEFELGLDLQLRPPSRSELSAEWRTVTPDLSLSLKGNVSNDSSATIKSEPYVDDHQMDALDFRPGRSKTIGAEHVIPERCMGNLPDLTTKKKNFDQQNPATKRMVKIEPPEQSSKECMNKSVDGTSTPIVTLENDKALHHHVDNESLDLNATTVFNGHLDVDTVINASKITVKSTSVALASIVNPCSEELSKNRETLDNTSNLQQVEGNATRLVVGSLISDSKESIIGTVASIDPFHESLQLVANDGVSEGSAEMDCSDGEYCTSKFIAKDAPHLFDSMEKNLGNEQIQESTNASSKIEELCDDNQPPCDGPHDPPVITHEKDLAHGSDVAQNKDNELKDHTQGLIKASDVIAAVDVAIRMPSDLESNSKQLQVSVGVTGSNANFCNGKNDINCSLTTELHEPPDEKVAMNSRNVKLAQSPEKATKKEIGPFVRSNDSSSLKDVKNVTRSQKVAANEGDAFTKVPVPIGIESDASGIATHHGDETGKTDQIMKVNLSSTNKFSLGKTNSDIDRLASAQTERDGLLFEKSHRSENSHSQVSRVERCDDMPLSYRGNDQQDRPLKYRRNDEQDRPVQKRHYDMMNRRRDGNHFTAYHPNSGPRNSTRFNNSRDNRFTRHSNGDENPWRTEADDCVGNDSRIMRRHMDDESLHRSHFSHGRRSPRYIRTHNGGSVVAQICESSRDVSPRRIIGRPIPDTMQDCDVIRCSPNEMTDPFLYTDPYMQYEDGEMHSTWRERSVSPTQRVPPPYLPPEPRRYHYAQSRRSPDMVYEEHRELTRHRSPPVDPLRSPSHLCFPEYAMTRHGLPYSRLRNDVRGVHPTREMDLRRPGRGGPRNMRRFDLRAQEENAEEDYLRSFYFSQRPRRPENGFFERRYLDDNHAYLQSYENHHPIMDDEDVGPPRPTRFCPNREGFSDGGSLRDPHSPCFKKPRSTSSRLRKREEEDPTDHGPPAWRDNGFNDGRFKRD